VSAPGSNEQLLEELDDMLDGRPTEVDDELGPLVQAAAELRAALAEIQLDPDAAERHLARVLGGSATVVPLPTRQREVRWRRRVAAVALAAALTLVPATLASAHTLPGQPLYPVKLAAEQVHMAAVSWSPTREAGVCTSIAGTRLDELDRLVDLGDAEHIPPAILALDKAVRTAMQAVSEASREDGRSSQVLKVQTKLAAVRDNGRVQVALVVATKLRSMPAATQSAIAAAIDQSPAISPKIIQPPPAGPATSTSAAPAPPPSGSSPSVTAPPVTTPPSTDAPAAPPSTAPPTSEPPTSEPAAPPTTADSPAGQDGQQGTWSGSSTPPSS
jgi:hypothetical protein